MDVQYFYDKETATLSYIVYDAKTRDAVIIDPVLDYNAETRTVHDENFKKLISFINEHKLTPHYCLETHAHADHLSCSKLLKDHFPGIQVAISEKIRKVQTTFKSILNLDESFKTDGSQFDKLIIDNEQFYAGSIAIHAIPTPGHTPACMSFHINNMVFCGDVLFVEDSGTGRCDFPDGSAHDLYISVHENLYNLPEETIMFVGHDYRPNERSLRFETTIGVSKRHNTHLKCSTTKEEYVEFREKRDKTLKAPRLLGPSLQVNLNAGILPESFIVTRD